MEAGENALMMIHVDDNGDGLTDAEMAAVVKRGVRLDEKAPGTGLGLSIVTDIAEMNGGQFTLSESPMGGLRATIGLRRS